MAWRNFFRRKELKVVTVAENFHWKIREEVEKGIVDNLSIGELSKGLQKRFKEQSPFWADRIANTEMMDSINGARFLGMGEEGVSHHVWVSAKDNVVRDRHRIDGEIVRVGEAFTNGLRYPHDDLGTAGMVINCRCVTAPVMREEFGPVPEKKPEQRPVPAAPLTEPVLVQPGSPSALPVEVLPARSWRIDSKSETMTKARSDADRMLSYHEWISKRAAKAVRGWFDRVLAKTLERLETI
jgi:SPP1 gp7 family putative phage head morphogenesis protein